MPTRSFWIVAGLLLVWALIGDAAYLMQVTADLTELAKTDPTTAQAFATMPEWAWSACAIAVWVATLAAIAPAFSLWYAWRKAQERILH